MITFRIIACFVLAGVSVAGIIIGSYYLDTSKCKVPKPLYAAISIVMLLIFSIYLGESVYDTSAGFAFEAKWLKDGVVYIPRSIYEKNVLLEGSDQTLRLFKFKDAPHINIDKTYTALGDGESRHLANYP